MSDEEYTTATHLVFPYAGIYVRHLGSDEAVAEASQVLFFNVTESYRVSHPVSGGDSSLTMVVDENVLRELAPKRLLRKDSRPKFNVHRLRLDAPAQQLVARLHVDDVGIRDTTVGEELALELVRHALAAKQADPSKAGRSRRRLVDSIKLLIASDLSHRWSLAEIGALVGASPVYLTQTFRAIEGSPLCRYQLNLRLAAALNRIRECDDLTQLALDSGFSSHSHFSAAFRARYGRSPSEFRK